MMINEGKVVKQAKTFTLRERMAGAGHVMPANSRAEHQSRCAFIAAVRESYPDFFKTLARDVYPPFLACRDLGIHDIPTWIWPFSPPFYEMPPAVERLLDGLERWAGSFHAQVPWVYRQAVNAMRAWSKDEAWLQQLRWVDAEMEVLHYTPYHLIELPPAVDWCPPEESKAALRARVHSLVDECLGEVFAEIKPQRSARFQTDHVRVFVERQIGGRSASCIAKRLDCDEAEIRRQTRRVARLLGWPPERLSRGKRGKRNAA